MIRKVVSCDSFATLMVMNRSLETTPEVFRGQPNLNLVLKFEDYVDFVEKYINKINILATPTLRLSALIGLYRLQNSSSAQVELFSAFLKDVSFAISKELYFAGRLGKGATRITHEVSKGTILTKSDINDFYNPVAPEIESNYRGCLSGYGFTLNRVSDENIDLWKYAVVCYYLASTGKFLWSVKLN